jgi:hypothetical protein
MNAIHELMTEAFFRLAGPLALIGFCFWLAHYKEPLWEAWVSGRNRFLTLFALSLAAAGLVYASVPVGFKVLSDETNLLSVANMLSQFGKASNTQIWLYYYHEYHPQNLAIPTRPVLFPALTALVQAFIGMSAKAPFVVNFLFYVFLAGLVLHWTRGFVTAASMVFVYVLCLLMNPALSVMSASAGFDLLSLFFAFATFLALRHYLRRRDEFSLRGLLLAALCFSSVRYESILVFPVLLAGLCWHEREDVLKRISWLTWSGLFILMVPLIVQRGLTWGAFENPPGVAPFSPLHLLKHAPIFLRSFFFDFAGPFPVVLHWLGLLGIFVWWRRPQEKNAKALFLIAGAYVGVQILLLLSHHFGVANHPTQARLFVPISFALTLAAFPLLALWQRHAGILVLGALLLFLHHHRFAMKDELTNRLTMTREMRYLRDFGVGEARPGRGADLFVYDRPGQLVALGESAVSWPFFQARRPALEQNLQRGLYQRILFVERVPYAPKPEKKSEEAALPARKPLFERQLSEEEKLLVSVWEAQPSK